MVYSLFVCAVLLVGVHAGVVYLLSVRTWGFDFLTFYPSYVSVCAYAVALAVAVPHINLSVAKHLEKIIGHVRVNKAFLWGVLCLVFGVLCYLFKQKYAFLGDGYLRLSDVVDNKYSSPYGQGPVFLLMQLQKWVQQWDATGVVAFQVFSIFFGVPYIVLACLWSDLIGQRRVDKVFCFLLMVVIGSIQYFFGYVEVYAPLPSIVLAFILFGVLALRHGKLPIWSTVCFVVGVALHVLVLFLTPAVLFLWWWSLAQKYPIFRDRTFIVAGALVFLVLGCSFVYQKSNILLSVSDIFSLSHGWEFLNSQLLSAPVVFPLLVLAVFFGFKFGQETSFLFVCAGGALFSLFVIDAVRGSVDWDIYALSGVPLMALATYCLQHIKNRRVKQYGALFSCVCAGVLVASFVHINHTDRSIDRVSQIIKDDPGTYYDSHSADMTLAFSFKSAGLEALAFDYFERAYKEDPFDHRNAFNMGIALLGRNKYQESISYFFSAVALSPDYSHAFVALLWIVLHYPDLVVEGVETHLHKSKHNDFWLRLGAQGIKKGKVQQVHDLSADDALLLVARTQLFLAEKDTTRAVSLMKNALLGKWEK